MGSDDQVRRTAFGKRVAALRDERGFTQSELGRQVGVSPTCVWNWESGNTFPRRGALEQLAKALGSSVEHLADGRPASPRRQADEGNSEPPTLAQRIQAAREDIAAAAGLDVSRVKIVLDYCD